MALLSLEPRAVAAQSTPSPLPGKLASDIETRAYLKQSFWVQAAQHALTAIASAFFIGWWALAWWIAMMAMLLGWAAKTKNNAGENVTGAPLRIAIGTTLFASVWFAAWIVGGEHAGFLAGAMLATSAGYGATFFPSNIRLQVLAFVGPAFAAALLIPFLTQRDPAQIVVVLTVTVSCAVILLTGRATRRKVYAEIQRTQAAADAAQSESLAKSQFLATMSHELHTPLNAVLGYAELLEEDLTADGRVSNAEDAVRIRNAARRLLTLIDDILIYSSIDTGKMTAQIAQTEIEPILSEVIADNAATAQQRNVTISVAIDPSARTANTDPERLRQCLANLVSNAVKFTKDGRVDIAAASDGDGDNAFLKIAVRNTGSGISEENQAQLFKPFSQVDGTLTRTNDGAGLGLAITSRLAQMLGGSVSYGNAEGGGSVFTLRVRAYA